MKLQTCLLEEDLTVIDQAGIVYYAWIGWGSLCYDLLLEHSLGVYYRVIFYITEEK